MTMTILAVFKSRTHTLDFARRLSSYGIYTQTVPSPKEARIGCSVCVKFDFAYIGRAKILLRNGNYSSFVGFLRADMSTGYLRFVPIY